MDEISKKDILIETGISYGQLYRWKREGLIPEEWFVKRSAFTGQETFFPRDRMLARVRSILAMKDTSSLDQIRERLADTTLPYQVKEVLLNRSTMSKSFVNSLEALKTITELSIESIAAVIALYEMCKRAGVKEKETKALIDSALSTVAQSAYLPTLVVLAKSKADWHFIMAAQATWVAVDSQVTFVETLQVSDVAERIRNEGATSAKNKG